MPRRSLISSSADNYREGGAAFPSECGENDYRKLLEAACPIHPELFARLNDAWGGLDKFQRTRGVLRLMASVVNVLWEQGDKSLMIMPSSVPLDEPTVHSKLLDYLPHPWGAIVDADIDGGSSLAFRIDKDNPNLQRYGATRRVARAIFLATAPHAGAPKRGIEDRRVRLGTVQPGETAGTFGDALRRLADEATYLYPDGNRYWFDTQPTVTRLAEQGARDLDEAEVWAKLVERLAVARAERGPFAAVQVAPRDSSEVPDDPETRLIVLGPAYPYAQTGDSAAVPALREILERRGQSPRIYRNALLFLASDRRRLSELEQALRSWMAWKSIADQHEKLQLTPFQRRQAEGKTQDAERRVDALIRETWVWTIRAEQPEPTKPEIEISAQRVSGDESLAIRAGKKFVNDGVLLEQLGARGLRQRMDQHDLWRGADHVSLKQVATDFATYLYLPRLRDRQLLIGAVQASISQLVCDQVAYAEAYDPVKNRYEGLYATGSGSVPIVLDDAAVIVKAEAASAQLARERVPLSQPAYPQGTPQPSPAGVSDAQPSPAMPSVVRRFYGSFEFKPDRLVREAGAISAEVLEHVARLDGARVTLRLEIDIDIPGGINDDARRIVEENCRTLKFRSFGFEAE